MVNCFVSLLPALPRKSDGMLAKVEVGKMVGNFKMLIWASLFLQHLTSEKEGQSGASHTLKTQRENLFTDGDIPSCSLQAG